MKKKTATTEIIDFLSDRVLNVTELARSNKLSQILDEFDGKKNTDVYVIQHNKKKSKAVIIDLEYFRELLALKEAIEWATDEVIEQIAIERMDKEATVSADEAAAHLGFTDSDIDDILRMANEVEEED